MHSVNETLRSRGMTLGVSCLLHLGLATGLILGQQWVIAAVAVRPPILPVQLVTLETAEELPAPPAPAPRERIRPPRLIEQPRLQEPPPAVKVEQPAPPPMPSAPVPMPIAPAPIDMTPAPASEPVAAPGPPATTIVPSFAPPSAPPAAVVARPSPVLPEGVTQYARPQGGYQVRPTYPVAPRRLGIQGTTLLRVHVLADGRIGDVLVEKSAGHPELDEAAADAVRRWRFEPARRGAEAVAMWVLLPVEFRLR
jgi:protein TonB